MKCYRLATLFASVLVACGCSGSNHSSTARTTAASTTTSPDAAAPVDDVSSTTLRAAPTNTTPILGRKFGVPRYQSGFGQVRPSRVFLGGDPTGDVFHVRWPSWGGQRAIGHGTGYYEPPGKIVAESFAAPVTVVAFNLGTCHGKRAYKAIEWFYPQYGGTFDAGHYINICTGDYVGGGMRSDGR